MPVTRAIKFIGGVVVSQVSPGKALVDAVGTTGAWDVLGNAGGGLKLGTTTNSQWTFVQNNQERGGFNTLGQFFLKSHTGTDGTEFKMGTSIITTSDALPTTIYELTVPDLATGRLTARIQGRKSDGTGRAAFERSFLFYREGANVSLTAKLQTDFTDKTDASYDVNIITTGGLLTIKVVGKNLETINWSGTFEYQMVS